MIRVTKRSFQREMRTRMTVSGGRNSNLGQYKPKIITVGNKSRGNKNKTSMNNSLIRINSEWICEVEY